MKHSTCQPTGASRHDTHQLPAGGFYFAPGAVEQQPPRASRLRRWLPVVAEVAVLLAIAAAVGVASGWLHAKGLL